MLNWLTPPAARFAEVPAPLTRGATRAAASS